MFIKVFKLTCISILLIFVIIITILSFLYSKQGIRFILNITKYWIPELTVEHIDGNINNLILSNISYKTDYTNVNIDKIKLSFLLSSLINGEFCINNIKVNNVNINISKELFFKKKML